MNKEKEIEIPSGYKARIEGNKIIFELKESEDERIRKGLIEYLESDRDCLPCQDVSFYNDAIAYLKKQKEQKLTPDWMPKFLDELCSKKNYFDWDEHRDIEGKILAIINWIAPNYFIKKEKEQKSAENPFDANETMKMKDRIDEGFTKMMMQEQKPVEWKQENNKELTDFENAMMHIGCSFFGKNAGLNPNDTITIKEQANLLLTLIQMPVKWSERDKRIMNELITIVGGGKVTSGTYICEYVAWLKDLPNRFNLQPKQEWSKEDEKMLDAAIDFVKQNNSFDFILGIDKDFVIDWLKSLHPQSHWKPTYKQMAAIEECLQFYTESTDTHQHLKSLLNNLKKL